MSLYLDHAFRQPPTTYTCFRANGIAGIARYYDGGRVPGKGLTLDEARDIAAANLRLHAVYETSGGADIPGFAHDGDYFTHSQGWRDWTEAVVDANTARQPKSTPIFLAVDRHMPAADPRLVAYFRGATEANSSIGGSGYFIGCYGPDYVCELIRDTFGIQHLWPWLPRPPAYPQFDYTLWQYENGQNMCGVAVDFNDCQIEGWIAEGENMTDYVTRAEFEAYQQNVRETLEGVDGGATADLGGIKGILNDLLLRHIRHTHDTSVPRPQL